MDNHPLTSHEIEVLEMLNGDRKAEWGAWVGACCESLKESGYAQGMYEITERGVAFLAARKGGAE